MGKVKVAVCEADEGYRSRFVMYLMEHRREEMEIYAFSSPEVFAKELETAAFGLILLGGGFAGEAEEVQKRKIPLLILSEDMIQHVAESCEYETEEQRLTVQVFKYQPMENILHEIKGLTGGREPVAGVECAGLPRMEIIGVYSPVKHEMQMPFTLVFANEIGKKRKVLYINLMAYPGFLELFQLASEYDLGDVVVRLRKKRLLPEIFMRGIYEIGRVSYLPPFSNQEDLTQFTWEDYLAILKFLEEKTPFETVIFDFGDGLAHFADMLARCSSIYCPMKSGYFYACRMEQFLAYVRQVPGLEQKLQFVDLPFTAKAIIDGGNIFERLLWSEFGDYVRNYGTGGGL